MGIFPSFFSYDIIYDTDLFPSLPPCKSIMSSSCASSMDKNKMNVNITVSSDERSACNRLSDVDSNSSIQSSIQIQEISHDVVHNHDSFDEQKGCCESRQTSSAITCPLSNSHECWHRTKSNSELIRFQERRYEQATWQMYYRISKAKAERGCGCQRIEKVASLNFEENDDEQSIFPNEHSLLDMEVFRLGIFIYFKAHIIKLHAV